MITEQQPWIGPGDMAKRLGVTTKALKVYEREGLVAPLRTQSGWRVYGPRQVERLHLIVVLRDLGLSLKDIKVAIDTGGADLQSVLSVQQETLEDQRRRISRAIGMLQLVRDKLKAGRLLSLEELAELARDTVGSKSMSMKLASDRLEALLAAEGPDGDRMIVKMAAMAEQLAAQPGGKAAIEREFSALMTQAQRLMAIGDDSSVDAVGMMRRWNAFTHCLERPDPRLREAVGKAFQVALADPDFGSTLPFDPAVFFFLKRVADGMQRRGERQ